MALNIANKYPGKSGGATAAYPFGSAQNITTPGDQTGTPLEQSWLNDLFGFQQTLLDALGESPTELADAVGAYQYAKALMVTPPTVAAAVAASMVSGQAVLTKGYTAAADGGHAFYTVKTSGQATTDGDVVDELANHTMTNGNVLVLQPVNRAVLIEQCGASSGDSSDAIESAVSLAALRGLNVGTALPSSVLDRPLYFLDASVNNVVLDFSVCDFSLTGVRTLGTEFDWEYAAFTFFGKDEGAAQDNVLVSDAAAGGNTWESSDTSFLSEGDSVVVEVDPAALDFSTKIVWRLATVTKIVSATEFTTEYIRSYAVPLGETVRYQKVTPVTGVSFKCKSVSYDRPYSGSSQDKLEASSGVSFYKARNCSVNGFNYIKNPKQAAHFEFTNNCSADNVEMRDPVETTSGGYCVQFAKSMLFTVDSIASDEDRHLLDFTASSNGTVERAGGVDTTNSTFTTHGTYEHDITYSNCQGHFQLAGSGPTFGESCSDITVLDHVGTILNAQTKVKNLTIKRARFESVANVNADGVVFEDVDTENQLVWFSSSSDSDRPNRVTGGTLTLGGVSTWGTGVDIKMELNNVTIPDLPVNAFEATGAELEFRNCNLANSGGSAIVTPILLKSLKLRGGSLSGVLLSYTSTADQALEISEDVSVDYNNRPNTLALLLIAKTAGIMVLDYLTAKAVSTTGRHITAITAGATLKVRLANANLQGGTINISSAAVGVAPGYFLTNGLVMDGVTDTLPADNGTNIIRGSEVNI